jgi:hypothetical protein
MTRTRHAKVAASAARAHDSHMSRQHRSARVLGVLGVTLIAGVALALATPRAHADETGDHPACIEVRGHARYSGYGYDHVVTVRNGCDRAAVCAVSTSVNPQAANVSVAAAASSEVVMWRGSPAREFAPRADCTLSGAQPPARSPE